MSILDGDTKPLIPKAKIKLDIISIRIKQLIVYLAECADHNRTSVSNDYIGFHQRRSINVKTLIYEKLNWP